jgi:polysaccharide biosynthesis transport protein
LTEGNISPGLPPKKSKSFDLRWFLSRRLKAILIGGGAMFAFLLPFAILKGNYSFETSGRFLIAREAPRIIGRNEDYTNLVNYFHDYAKTQVERIKSPENLQLALKSLPEQILRYFKPEKMSLTTAAAILQGSLDVGEVGSTHLIQVKLKGGAAEGLAEMVNAIMNSYIQRLREESENKDSRRIAFLIQERDALKKAMETKSHSLEKMVQQTMTSDFQANTNVNLQKYLIIQDAYLRAYTAKVVAENIYTQTEAEAGELKKLNNKVLADEKVAGDQALSRTASWTYEKMQDLRASIDGVTKNNSDRQYIEQRMKGMQQYELTQREEVRKQADKIVKDKREYELAKRILGVKSEYLSKTKTADQLKEEMEKIKIQLETSLQEMVTGQQLMKVIENNRQKYFDLENRIRDLILEAKTPSIVSIESYAVTPSSPSSSNRQKLVMMSLLISFGLPAATFFVIDFLDNHMHSPQDITNYLGTPPLWPISEYQSNRVPAVPFERLTLDDPNHNIAKAFGSLAVRLNKEQKIHGAKIALFNGVNEQSGVTAICLNTAQIMRLTCDKIILIDANNIHPALSDNLGANSVPSSPIDFKADEIDLMPGIFHDAERQIDILSLARLDRTLWSGHLPTLLQALKRDYDFIVIDSAPILRTDLTEMLVVQTDIEVLVVQGDRSYFKDFTRSVEIMLRLEVPALATVLNWGGPKAPEWTEEMIAKLTDRAWIEATLKPAEGAIHDIRRWLQRIKGKWVKP